MARTRKYRDDLIYSDAHRRALPELYGRIGHRIDMADRDWTEFCAYCKRSLLVVEMVRDVGQDLSDKATTVTRDIAARAKVEACLLAYRVERSPEDQKELDELNRRIDAIEARSKIVGFKTCQLWPRHERRLTVLTPEEWWRSLYIRHRDHHKECRRAKEYPVKKRGLLAAKRQDPTYAVGLLDLLDDAVGVLNFG